VTKDSDFATRLEKVCAQMIPAAGDRATASNFAAANLSGLQQACADIRSGQPLPAADVASLRAFWTDPTTVENQLANALTTAARTLIKNAQANPQSSPPFPPISSGSLESDIIQGLAQFVYDRAKQEATLYLSKELAAKLCTGDTAVFFPAVCVALPTDPTIPLGAMGSYLAAAARTDLGKLPDRALAYKLHDMGKAKEKTPEGEGLFGARLALAYYQTVRNGRSPLDVARSMHEIQVPSSVVGADTDVLKMTGVLSELVDSVQAQEGWTNMLKSGLDPLPYYALGAVFTFESQYKTDGAPFGPIPDDKIAAVIPVVTQYLINVANLADRAAAVKLSLTTPVSNGQGDFVASGGGPSDLTMRDYTVVVTQTLAQTFESGQKVLTGLGINVSPSVSTTITALEGVTQIGEQTISGQSAGDLAVLLIPLLNQLIADLPDGTAPKKALTDIQQLLALIAQIAQAKSADEVANVLNAAAVPPTTYELKYRRGVVALGALAGLSGGYEWVRASGPTWNGGGMVGAFAPIGLTASTPFGDNWMHAGVMFSVLNLGALVSTRFSQDIKTTSTAAGTMTTTVQTDPEVKLINVLAPGVFFTLGIARSPFVVAVGGQVVPAARQLTTMAPDGTTSTSTAPAIQLMGALSVDVPIFTF
jgi:hypothetical protein